VESNPSSELRARREALVAAVNARDMDAIKAIIHPSFTSRSTVGPAWTYQQMLEVASRYGDRRR
jgi:hypothetical protein